MSPISHCLGDELPPLVIESVDAEKMKLMAAILRDPNPIHFDAAAVKTLGLGDRVINQGPSNMSYVLNMVTNWAGGIGTLRRAEMRLLGNVFAGDRVECTGRVSAVDQPAGLITVDVVASVDSRPVLQGQAVIAV